MQVSRDLSEYVIMARSCGKKECTFFRNSVEKQYVGELSLDDAHMGVGVAQYETTGFGKHEGISVSQSAGFQV